VSAIFFPEIFIHDCDEQMDERMDRTDVAHTTSHGDSNFAQV